MRALAELGEREQALREYERCREALLKIFRVKPAVQSERLYEAIRARPARKGERQSTFIRRRGKLIHNCLTELGFGLASSRLIRLAAKKIRTWRSRLATK